MRILVSGGAGFVGSHLVDRLLALDHEIVAVDNFVTGRRRNIAHLAGSQRFRLVEHDVSEPLFVDGPLDAILHLASPASPVDFLRMPIQILKANSLGTYYTLGMAKLKQARYLLASTSEIYGDPTVHPQVESYAGNVDPIGPRGAYDEAKRFAEAMTMAYHRMHGVDTRIVRIFNTYGPRMRLDEPITVYGDGSQTRSFTYVTDLVDGIVRLLESAETGPVNLGNPEEMSILTFAERIHAATMSAADIRHVELPESRLGDPARRCPDIARARRILGWEPRVDLDHGLAETIAWFRAELDA